jgi:HK97 gp10 family phage protein
MNITLDIPNQAVNDMLRQVRFYQARKRAQLVDLIEETTNAIADDAAGRVPVESGNLKKKIRAVLEAVNDELAGHVVADDFYAKFVELGTSAARAHPFMLPAYEAHMPGFLIKLKAIFRS